MFDPPDVAAELGAGRAAHKRGDLGAAVELYRAVAVRCLASVDAWMNLGSACVLLGRATEATSAFERATSLAPAEPRVWRDAATGLAAIGRLDAARVAFERAVALDGGQLGAWLSLARLNLEGGDRVAAQRCTREVLDRDPAQASASVELARCVFEPRDLAPSIAALARALALDPGHAFARYLLATMACLSGDEVRAVAAIGVLEEEAVPYADSVRGFRLVVGEGRERVQVLASRREAILASLDLAMGRGPVVELGVRHGVSTRWIAGATRARLLAFDSFEGLPEAWKGRGAGLFTAAGEIPELPPHVEIHKGRFEETLVPALEGLREPVRFVHVDCDLYASARFALDALAPHLVPGAVLLFDEYFLNDGWRHDEHRALEEAAAAAGWSYEYVVANPFTGQAAVRLR